MCELLLRQVFFEVVSFIFTRQFLPRQSYWRISRSVFGTSKFWSVWDRTIFDFCFFQVIVIYILKHSTMFMAVQKRIDIHRCGSIGCLDFIGYEKRTIFRWYRSLSCVCAIGRSVGGVGDVDNMFGLTSSCLITFVVGYSGVGNVDVFKSHVSRWRSHTSYHRQRQHLLKRPQTHM